MPIEKFESKKVPFGLAQASTHILQLINKVLEGLLFHFGHWTTSWYLVKNNDNHHEHLKTVCDKFWAIILKLKATKCDLFKGGLHYVGHLISGKGIYFLLEKLQSIKSFQYQNTYRS